MPAVVLERPKMSRALWEALKVHIMRERQRKRQEQEADAEVERQRRERERKQKQDVMTLEETREQLAQLESRLAQLKDEKHQLFLQLKKVLNEDETRRRQLVKDHDVMVMHGYSSGGMQLGAAPPQIFMQAGGGMGGGGGGAGGGGLAQSSRPPIYKLGAGAGMPHPQHTLLPHGTMKRSRSPSPPPQNFHPSYAYKASIPSSYAQPKIGQGSPYYVSSSGVSFAPPPSQAPLYTTYAAPPPPPPPPSQQAQQQRGASGPPSSADDGKQPPQHVPVYLSQTTRDRRMHSMHAMQGEDASRMHPYLTMHHQSIPDDKFYPPPPVSSSGPPPPSSAPPRATPSSGPPPPPPQPSSAPPPQSSGQPHPQPPPPSSSLPPPTHVQIHGGGIPIQGSKPGGITSGYPIRGGGASQSAQGGGGGGPPVPVSSQPGIPVSVPNTSIYVTPSAAPRLAYSHPPMGRYGMGE